MDIYGFVGLRSELAIEELAALLSQTLCGGLEFGGREESLKDEVPAVYTLRTFLGLDLTLYGDQEHYTLELW